MLSGSFSISIWRKWDSTPAHKRQIKMAEMCRGLHQNAKYSLYIDYYREYCRYGGVAPPQGYPLKALLLVARYAGTRYSESKPSPGD